MISLNPNRREKRGIRAWSGTLKEGALEIQSGSYFRDIDTGFLSREPNRKPRTKRFLLQGVAHDEIAAITIRDGLVVVEEGRCRDGAVWVMERKR